MEKTKQPKAPSAIECLNALYNVTTGIKLSRQEHNTIEEYAKIILKELEELVQHQLKDLEESSELKVDKVDTKESKTL